MRVWHKPPVMTPLQAKVKPKRAMPHAIPKFAACFLSE